MATCIKKRRPYCKKFKKSCKHSKFTKSTDSPSYEKQLHETLKPDFKITRNPYLNYFRQFYAEKRGRVVEAAIVAGANWRQMSASQKEPYIKAAKNAPYLLATKVKRLSRSSTSTKGAFSFHKLLVKWTKLVYEREIEKFIDEKPKTSKTRIISCHRCC